MQMKVLIVLVLALACVAALPSTGQRFMPVVGKHEGRIVGGKNADIKQFSYQVGLDLVKNSYTTMWCGGSLIAPNWVLTAAHCTDGVKELTVYLGSATRAEAEVQFKIVRTYDNIIEHEGFDEPQNLNDIALIKIPTVQYSDTISAVRLPPRSVTDATTFEGEYATASGWGRMGDRVKTSTTMLQYLTLRIISNAECAEYYGRTVTDGNICLNTRATLRSTCDGDSGGPLVLKDTNILIGVTSYGSKFGCQVGAPVAFARISHFMDWIVSKTGITF